jgi:multidrug efflux pump subunit AcrA (membrane-fusion protein)
MQRDREEQAPNLDITRPIRCGVVLSVLLAAGLGGAAAIDVRIGQNVTGRVVERAERVDVVHKFGGKVEHIHVAVGAWVKPGDILISLETAAIGGRIAAMKREAEAAQAEIGTLKADAFTLLQSSEAHSGGRQKLIDIEQKVSVIEKNTITLEARIERAERELPEMQLRASIAGKIERIYVQAPGTELRPDAAAVSIAPLSTSVQLDAPLGDMDRHLLQAGHTVEVRPSRDAITLVPLRLTIERITPSTTLGGGDILHVTTMGTGTDKPSMIAPHRGQLTLFTETARTSLWAALRRYARDAIAQHSSLFVVQG